MTDSREEHVGESSASHKRSKRKRQYHRHTVEQIQQLEAFFKQCRHPDEDQREQLSKEVRLDSKQIKCWFQNKITQAKIQNERSDNNTLRLENEKFRSENMAMKEAMKNIMCLQCDEERARNIENMKMENQRLREKNEKLSNFISSVHGKSFVTGSDFPAATYGGSGFSS